MLKNFLFNS